MPSTRNTAGGRAAQTGLSFQAHVATWFAAHLAADVPIGSRFGLPSTAKAMSLQCESGDAMDDIVVRLAGGGAIFVQCKTRPSLSPAPDSPLGKTIAQLVALRFQIRSEFVATEPVIAVLAVASTAVQSLDALEAACRQFDYGGVWSTVHARQPEERAKALDIFETLVRASWPSHKPEPDGSCLTDLARLFRISRFSEEVGGHDWRDSTKILGECLYGSPSAGDGPAESLLAFAGQLIRTSAPADRAGIMRALRTAGHEDISSPRYDSDLRAIIAYSFAERQRLSKHTRLPIDGGVRVVRECMEPLAAAVRKGSLLVLGEPGAGKTGLLLNLAEHLSGEAGPVVFLSVERFSGFRTQADFLDEIKIKNSLVDVLENWPGTAPGVLLIDALDASRGGPSEIIVTEFIIRALERLTDRWSVVASIRTFDLKNGRRFRDAYPGTPPDPNFAEDGLDRVRHFKVAALTPIELAGVADLSTALYELVHKAPPKLCRLLRNVFNLSLAADLLSDGASPTDIAMISTQSELIERYEESRLPDQRLRLAATAAVTRMVEERELTVRSIDVPDEAIDDVLKAGVLVPAGDKIAFAHHVLFDHLAGRFFLKWHRLDDLRAQLSSAPAMGLLLGPALRFALEFAWRDGEQGPTRIWSFLERISADGEADPVAVSVTLRTATEHVEAPADVTALCHIILAPDEGALRAGKLVGRVARFLGLVIADRGALQAEAASAWASVALAAARSNNLYLADGGRVILQTIGEKADLDAPHFLRVFGEAARALLQCAWAANPQQAPLVAAAIRLVTQSYGSNPAASRSLLAQILEDAHLALHASVEAPWLAEGVPRILAYDPEFVAEIYGVLFGHKVDDEGKTWVGGQQSRILALTSTRRQDFQHAQWRLTESLGLVLNAAPREGTIAVIRAVRGLATESSRVRTSVPGIVSVETPAGTIKIVDDFLSLQDWRVVDSRGASRDHEILSKFVAFLRGSTPSLFTIAVEVALRECTPASVWGRILGVAADRDDLADELLWQVAANPALIVIRCLTRDAVFYLAAKYRRASPDTRRTFERCALDELNLSDNAGGNSLKFALSRFLSIVAEDTIATPEMRATRQILYEAGQLTGNHPLMRLETSWAPAELIIDNMLRAEGVDIERSPDRELRAAGRAIEEEMKAIPEKDLAAASVATLWHKLSSLLALAEAPEAAAAQTKVTHSSWGILSNGVERICKTTAYDPDKPGHPNLSTILAVIDRLATSPYPEESDDGRAPNMAWGNWDVRVYAASSAMALAARFANDAPPILQRLPSLLRDPVPTVRLQVAQSLNILWNVARSEMWALVEQVVAEERSNGVINFFVGGPLTALSSVEPARCAELLSVILNHQWTTMDDSKAGRDRDAEPAAALAAWLWVSRESETAKSWIDRWTLNQQRGESHLSTVLFSIRSALFLGYTEMPDQAVSEIAGRAKQIVENVAAIAAAKLKEARPHLVGKPDEATIIRWRGQYETADCLLEQLCNQLYFGSGAFQNGQQNETPGLATVDAKRAFLTDYGSVLDELGSCAQVRTVHHLVEMLSFLADADPSQVFDRLSVLLLGAGAEDLYHFELLAAGTLVALVRRYLADFRNIFFGERRDRLVKILELFSSAGWPAASGLLFELPDLLR